MIGSPLEVAPAGAAEADEPVELTELCAQLRRLARSLDALWRESLSTAAGRRLSMRLGAASHGVHRALIALQDDRAGGLEG